MALQTIQERLPVVAQAVAMALVIFYTIGFIVLALNHASFGISQFNLLRPRIIAAGVLFGIFISVPIAEAARIFGLLGYTPMFPTPKRADGEFDKRLYYLPFVRLLAFLLSAMAISWMFRVFIQESKYNSRLILWTVATVVPAAAAAIVVRYRGQRNPALTAWMCLLTLAWILFCVTRVGDWPLIIMLAWFFGCGLIAHFVDTPITGSKKVRDTNWGNCIVWTIATLTFFALLLYPQIRWSLGGGAPVPISLRFENKSPLDDAGQTSFWLIDETDAGFYVLSKRDAKRAVFLPRSAVSTIYFGTDSPVTETPDSSMPQKKATDKQSMASPDHSN